MSDSTRAGTTETITFVVYYDDPYWTKASTTFNVTITDTCADQGTTLSFKTAPSPMSYTLRDATPASQTLVGDDTVSSSTNKPGLCG